MGAHEEIRSQLRGIVFQHDADALLDLLSSPIWPPDALQLIGEGLLDALRDGVTAPETPAQRCVSELHDRDWEGGDVLADALEARLGTGAVPLPIDLDELSTGLEGDGSTTGGRINVATGEFWHETNGSYDYLEDEDSDDDEDEREWLWVEGQGSRDGYRDMEAFIDRIDDDSTADLLAVAITGPGAFRRFKDTLARRPDLHEAWFSFSDDRKLGRARAWLAAQGYTRVRS